MAMVPKYVGHSFVSEKPLFLCLLPGTSTSPKLHLLRPPLHVLFIGLGNSIEPDLFRLGTAPRCRHMSAVWRGHQSVGRTREKATDKRHTSRCLESTTKPLEPARGTNRRWTSSREDLRFQEAEKLDWDQKIHGRGERKSWGAAE